MKYGSGIGFSVFSKLIQWEKTVRAAKLLAIVFLLSCSTPVIAQNNAAIEIGKNLKVGMPLKEAISLLGIPASVKVGRGTEPAADSIVIEYLDQGIMVYALNKGTLIEGIEVLPTFKGLFSSGVKIGDKFPTIIEKYGTPQSLVMETARYPELGLYLHLKDDVLLSAKMFVKGSKLLDSRLANPTSN